MGRDLAEETQRVGFDAAEPTFTGEIKRSSAIALASSDRSASR